MSSLYEKSQKTVIQISEGPVTPETLEAAIFQDLSCTLKQVSFTAGQKQDIDATVLCSDEVENINGLPQPSEISMSGNFYRNPAQTLFGKPMTTMVSMASGLCSHPATVICSVPKSASILGYPDQRSCSRNLLAAPERQANQY